MNDLLETLSRKPVIGYISSLGASAISFLDDIMPWCQFAGIIIGLLVGVLTIIAKTLEIRKLKKHSKSKDNGIS